MALLAAGQDFVDIDVPLWGWAALVGFIVVLLLVDLVVFHREAHEVRTREAAIEPAVWVRCSAVTSTACCSGASSVRSCCGRSSSSPASR